MLEYFYNVFHLVSSLVWLEYDGDLSLIMQIVDEDISSFSISLNGNDFFGQMDAFRINLDILQMFRLLSSFQFMVYRMEDEEPVITRS